MNQEKLVSISFELGELLKSKDYSFTCAESCTGGWVGHSLTSVPGSSEWFGSSFITYSYEAKTQILGVSSSDLDNFGAVSEEIVGQMVSGALSKSGANVGVAISGIAGPTGGTNSKPVGTVFVPVAGVGGGRVKEFAFRGERDMVKRQASQAALDMLRRILDDHG